MKIKASLVLVAASLIGFCQFATNAPAQESKPQLYVVWDAIVYPDKHTEYEAGKAELIKLYRKHDFPWAWEVYRTDDFHYYFLMPIDNLAQLDKYFEFSEHIMEKAGTDYAAIIKRLSGTYESETMGTLMLRPDLSYHPEKPMVASTDWKYIEWSYYYLRPGMEIAAEKLAAEWRAYFKKQGINDVVNVFTSLMWSDLPVWVIATGAESEEAFHTQAAIKAANQNDDYLALTKMTMDGCRKYERRRGESVPELSYYPKQRWK